VAPASAWRTPPKDPRQVGCCADSGALAVRAYRIDEVKAYAGHADIAMTMRYVHHVPAHDAADRLSRIVNDSVHPPVHRTGDMERNSAQRNEPETAS
jgi:hypothetical protein